MLIEAEPFVANSSSLQLIENVAAKVIESDVQFSDFVSGYAKKQKNRLAFDIDMVQKYMNKDSEILEFGSVPLLLTGVLKSLEYNIQGIDIMPERFSMAINALQLNIIKCDIEKESLPFQDECFDGVLFNEIFEHLRVNLIFTMQEVYRVIKPGGLLLLSTPNLRSYSGICNIIFLNKSYTYSISSIYGEYEKLNKIGHMGHVREYTPGDVIEFLQEIGFSIEKIIFRNKYHQRYKKMITRILPILRPSFTVIARKL